MRLMISFSTYSYLEEEERDLMRRMQKRTSQKPRGIATTPRITSQLSVKKVVIPSVIEARPSEALVKSRAVFSFIILTFYGLKKICFLYAELGRQIIRYVFANLKNGGYNQSQRQRGQNPKQKASKKITDHTRHNKIT